MKHVAAYLLAVLGGKANPTPAEVIAIMDSVGAKHDDAKVEQLCKELAGKNVFEVIEAGKTKMGSVAVAAAPAAAPAAPAAEEKKEEKKGGKKDEKKEEKKEKEKEKPKEEEEEADMGLDLFS